ncbi:hypothetical protein MIMGU_mgv1a018449mg, partial [Erythranthe guttata]
MKVTILPNLEADEISAIEALLMLASGVGRDSSPPPSSDSTAPTTTRVIASNPNKKIHHECSICHKGFSTGQALGGHMTSHRNKKIKKSSHGGSRPCNAAAAPIPILTNKNIPKCGQKRKHVDNDEEVILIIKGSGDSNYKDDYSRPSPTDESARHVRLNIDLNLPPAP